MNEYMSNDLVFITMIVSNFHLELFEVPFDYWTLNIEDGIEKCLRERARESEHEKNLIEFDYYYEFHDEFRLHCKIRLVIGSMSNFEDIPIYMHSIFRLYIRNMMRISTPVPHSQHRNYNDKIIASGAYKSLWIQEIWKTSLDLNNIHDNQPIQLYGLHDYKAISLQYNVHRAQCKSSSEEWTQ